MGYAAFLHFRRRETRYLRQKQWLHLLSKPSPGAKGEREGVRRRKSGNEGELRVAGSLSCGKKKGEAGKEMKREL